MPKQQGSVTRSVEVGNGVYKDFQAMRKAKAQGPVRNTIDSVKRHPLRSALKGGAVAIGVGAAYKLCKKALSSAGDLIVGGVKDVTDRAGRDIG